MTDTMGLMWMLWLLNLGLGDGTLVREVRLYEKRMELYNDGGCQVEWEDL